MAETDAESVRTERTESQAGDDPLLYLSEYNIEHLETLNRELSDVVASLQSETELFEKFCSRLDPKDLEPAPATNMGAPSVDFSQMRSRRRSRSRSLMQERLQRLTIEQKCELVQKELEEMKAEVQRDHESAERIMQSYKARMEEAEIRNTEIKKAKYEFERDIIKPELSSKKGERGSPDKIIHYMEEKTRARDSLVDKLRLKNTSLKVQKKKFQLQLKQKEEMGEILHEVDFQQLKIENAQFLERIDERNQDMLQLKLTTAEALQLLNTYKKRLHNMTTESSNLVKEIIGRKEMLQKIELETQVVEKERQKAESLNKRLRKQLSDYRVPEVMEYVQEKMELEELERNMRTWERKVELAELSYKTHRRAWEQLKSSSIQA
ncbi:cilia- and flagella-associated protein 263 isoform 1-T1 [Discoglossus pictus]